MSENQEAGPSGEAGMHDDSTGGTPTGSGTPTGGSSAGASDPSNRSLMLILSYLWILSLIPFLVVKDDAEVQWHAKHGLVLLVAEILLGIVTTMVGVIGCLMALLTPLLSLVLIALHVICIVKALKGERLLIPGISQFADRF